MGQDLNKGKLKLIPSTFTYLLTMPWSGLVTVGISVDIYAMVGVVVIVKVSVVGQKSVDGQTKDVAPSDASD